MNGGSCRGRGREEEREADQGAASLPACPPCGCNCNCNSGESHELCKHWQKLPELQPHRELPPTHFPDTFSTASTNKQIVCYYRWVALPDRVKNLPDEVAKDEIYCPRRLEEGDALRRQIVKETAQLPTICLGLVVFT